MLLGFASSVFGKNAQHIHQMVIYQESKKKSTKQTEGATSGVLI